MEPGLTETSFARLLERLDADRDRAGERYEDLRRTLMRFFEWRGAPFPEEAVDETLNRLARKLTEGVAIQNVGGYCYEIARLVFMETLKGSDGRQAPIETVNLEAPSLLLTDEATEKEARLTCLDTCLDGLPEESRELILEYYQDKKRGRIDRRQALAERLGLRREALANRAQRLRDKLERCVAVCLKQKTVDMKAEIRHL